MFAAPHAGGVTKPVASIRAGPPAGTCVGPVTVTPRNSALIWPPRRSRTSHWMPFGAPVMSRDQVPSAFVFVAQRTGGPTVTQTLLTGRRVLTSRTVPNIDGSTAYAGVDWMSADATITAREKAAARIRFNVSSSSGADSLGT